MQGARKLEPYQSLARVRMQAITIVARLFCVPTIVMYVQARGSAGARKVRSFLRPGARGSWDPTGGLGGEG